VLEDEDGQLSLPEVIEGEPISPADIEASQLTLDEVRVLAAPLSDEAAAGESGSETKAAPGADAAAQVSAAIRPDVEITASAIQAAGGALSLRAALVAIRDLLEPY
jgi:hypothetical protein